MKRGSWLMLGAILLCSGGVQADAAALAQHAPALITDSISFTLSPASPAMASCMAQARAQVTIVPGTQNDTLTLHATGLLPLMGFNLFATAAPRPPYGTSWLISQVQTDGNGEADSTVQAALLGAFSATASGSAASPSPAGSTHLVLFFANPRDAAQCPGQTRTSTIPSGGLAAFATLGFPDAAGPLHRAPLQQPGLGVSTPGGGHGFSAQSITFTSTCSHPNGWNAIRFIDFRFSQGGKPVFWVRLDRPAKRMYLYDPATGRWSGGSHPGSTAVLSTPYARLLLASSKVLGSAGTTGKVVWTVVFANAARGQTFQQSVQVTDLGYQTRGWNPSGSWSVD